MNQDVPEQTGPDDADSTSGNAMVDSQRSELDSSISPGSTHEPATRLRGLGRGIVIGAVVGAILASPLAAVGFGDLAVAARLLIVVLIGAVAGSVVGGVFFGSAVAELVDDDSKGDTDVVPDRVRGR